MWSGGQFLIVGGGGTAYSVVDHERVVGMVSQLAMRRVFLTVIRHRATAIDSVEQTGQDLEDGPESIEQMQRVFATLDRDQLATLLRRSR